MKMFGQGDGSQQRFQYLVERYVPVMTLKVGKIQGSSKGMQRMFTMLVAYLSTSFFFSFQKMIWFVYFLLNTFQINTIIIFSIFSNNAEVTEDLTICRCVGINNFVINCQFVYCHLVVTFFHRLPQTAEWPDQSKIKHMEAHGKACFRGQGGLETGAAGEDGRGHQDQE